MSVDQPFLFIALAMVLAFMGGLGFVSINDALRFRRRN